MPSSNLMDTGLALLTRGTPLSEDDQFEWLRRRARRVAARMQYFNHRNLGHSNAVGSAYTLWENAKFSPPNAELNSALSTRGIFFPPASSYRAIFFLSRQGRDENRIIWGITEEGQPTLVTITYEIVADVGGMHVVLKKIELEAASLQDISARTKKSVGDLAHDLGKTVREWREETMNNFEMVNLLWHEISLEDDMFEIASRRSRGT